jgi:hypothetical protein
MSGQDEKIGIIDTARWQYNALMKILRKVNPRDPYSLLPPELEMAVRHYECFGAISNSMEFRDKLSEYWKEINVSSELNPDIEKIADRSIFDDGL